MTEALLLTAMLLATRPEMNAPQSPFMAALREWKGDLAHVKVGDWVTYELASPDNMIGRGYWRFAVVAEEKDKFGRDAVWIEFDQGEHAKLRSPSMQMRMLVARQTGLRNEGITRMYLALGTMKPRELDDGALERFLKGDPDKKVVKTPPEVSAKIQQGDVRAIEGKPQSLLTHAGTVTASPIELRYKSVVLKRFWLSEVVPLWHMAKMEVPAIQATMELRDFGVGAQPQMLLPGPNEPKLTVQVIEDLASTTRPRPDDGYAPPVTDGGITGDTNSQRTNP